MVQGYLMRESAMTQLLPPEELIADLQHALQQRHPKPHPIRQLLLSGQLTKEQLQWWAKNQFHEFRNIHRFFGFRYQKSPKPELRRLLLENMVKEKGEDIDRKSTRLNSSHSQISYAVFCLKK